VAGFTGLEQANAGGNVEGLAALIFTRYLWAFELTSALLITAALGAMVLAHRERFERRKTQRELAQERFRPGGHATPMPAPGVYARHNAVDTPGLLPDGSPAEVTVPAALGDIRRIVPAPLLTGTTGVSADAARPALDRGEEA
jgi:NADH-quinone oxidoreductase subunit J